MITAITILSRMLGFGRWIVQASELGTGGVASSYATANVLPNVLFEVAAGGALAGAVLAQGVALLLAPEIARSLGRSTRSTGSLLGLWSAGVLLGTPFALRAGLGDTRVRAAAVGAAWTVTANASSMASSPAMPHPSALGGMREISPSGWEGSGCAPGNGHARGDRRTVPP